MKDVTETANREKRNCNKQYRDARVQDPQTYEKYAAKSK